MDPEEDEADDEQGQQDHRVAEAGTVREHRNAAGAGREQRQEEHRLPFAEPDGDEAMRSMVTATDTDASPGHDPRHGHEGGVEDRNGQEQDRNDQDRRDPARVRALIGNEREPGQEESKKQAAGVAHEDLGRREIARQESADGADERHGDERARQVALPDEEEQPERRRHDGDRARQPVHVVEEVERVGDADDPEQREQHVGERKAGEPEGEPEEEQDAAEQELGQQLGLRTQAAHVVDETDQRHRGRDDGQRHEVR